MPQIIFINRYFYPDESATSQILTDLARHLASRGFNVKIITSRLSYAALDKQYAARETIDNIEIVRVKTSSFGRTHNLGRAMDYLSFYLSAAIAILKQCKKGDVLVTKTDPPLFGIISGALGRFKKAIVTNWQQDIYPEIAERIDPPVIKPRLASFLRTLRNHSLCKANHIFVIGQQMKAFVRHCGVRQEKITVIHNWCNDKTIYPIPLNENELRKKWGFSDSDFIIAYSGNLGRAHDIATIIEAAKALRLHQNITFLFIGGGQSHRNLKRIIKAQNLENIILKPYQPRDQLYLSLGLANIHWLSLLPALEGTILPSKFYGIAAAGRAMLIIGDKQGEIATMIEQADCGASFAIGDSQALCTTILELAAQPNRCAKLGLNARAQLDSIYSKQNSLEKWEKSLAKIISKTP